MRALAFDPGKTTGYAIIEFGTGRSRNQSAGFLLVEAGQIPWESRFQMTKALLEQQDPSQVEAIVIESFRLYAHKANSQIGNDFPSAQMIGTISTYVHMLGLSHTIVLQPASEIARVAIRPEHDPGSSEHEKDAYKHARVWAIKKGIARPI